MKRPELAARLLSLSVFVMAANHLPQAMACDCVPQKICGMHYGEADFVGEMISRRLVSAREAASPVLENEPAFVYQMRVIESFTPGYKSGDVAEIWSGTGGADCSFHFNSGTRYLVDAEHDKKSRLWTSTCARTGRLEQRSVELDELRRRVNGTRQADLSGIVLLRRKYGSPEFDLTTLPRVRLLLNGADGRQLQAVADWDGFYEIERIPKGSYVLGVIGLPAHQRLSGTSLNWFGSLNTPLNIDGAHMAGASCHVSLEVAETGSISGKVVGRLWTKKDWGAVHAFEVLGDRSSGQEATAIEVEDDGTFHLSPLPAGAYILQFSTGYMGRKRGRQMRVFLGEGQALSGVTVPIDSNHLR